MLHATATIAGTLFMLGNALYAQRENARDEMAYFANRAKRAERRAAIRRTHEHEIARLSLPATPPAVLPVAIPVPLA